MVEVWPCFWNWPKLGWFSVFAHTGQVIDESTLHSLTTDKEVRACPCAPHLQCGHKYGKTTSNGQWFPLFKYPGSSLYLDERLPCWKGECRCQPERHLCDIIALCFSTSSHSSLPLSSSILQGAKEWMWFGLVASGIQFFQGPLLHRAGRVVSGPWG